MSNQSMGVEDGGRVDLREYLSTIRNHKFLIALFMLLVLGAALFYSMSQTPLYRSDAKVLVKALPVRGGAYTAPPNLETERELLSSEAIAELAEADLAPEEEGGVLSVTLAQETEILVIDYVHEDPLAAQRGAQAYAEAYLEYRRQEFLEDLSASSRTVENRIDALNVQLDELNEEIEDENDDATAATLQYQANALIGQIAILQQQLTDLTPPARLRVGQIVEAAKASASPFSPNHIRNGAMGAILGLLLGIGAALLRERLDDRIKGKEDLEAHLAAPVLAVIPAVKTWKQNKSALLISIEEPRAAASEAYRTLRTAILFAASQRNAHTILLTSAQVAEGKTVTTSNLGVALAQANKRVILISADLRKPRLGHFFDAPATPGVTEVVSGEVDLWSALWNPGIPNLRVLPSGRVPANPAELLGSDQMRRMLAEAQKAADFVIIDGPPILNLADAITLASLVDGVFLVVDSQKAHRSSVEHARTQLDQVNARLIGAVLNNIDTSSGRYEYRYKYYRTDYYEDPETAKQRAAAEKKRS